MPDIQVERTPSCAGEGYRELWISSDGTLYELDRRGNRTDVVLSEVDADVLECRYGWSIEALLRKALEASLSD